MSAEPSSIGDTQTEATDATDHAALDRVWSARLERALTGAGVQAVYQPIVDLRRREVVGFESLTRFQSNDGAQLTPDVWFGAAHALGLSEDLELVTLEAALASRPDLPSNTFLTINVEPESLLSPRIRSLLAAQGSLAGVVVEITEHRRLDIERLSGPLDWLRSTGALIAVDDAGAGYAGLQAILQLRPSILKLDRALVDGLDVDETKAALVEMMGLFAGRIDAWILAEGVETQGEARRLIDLGVPLAQGYLFARPAPPWADIDLAVATGLADFAERTGDNLFSLVEPLPAIRDGDLDPRSLSFGRGGWVAVVDADRHPRGLLTSEAALTGELIRPLLANVHSAPAEVAHRLSTAADDPAAPVVVTDNAGRYLGIVTMRRLLAKLAGNAAPVT